MQFADAKFWPQNPNNSILENILDHVGMEVEKFIGCTAQQQKIS
jgi:hypothetical protein